MSQINETAVRLPLLALRGMVVFPRTVASFDVARKKSANALKAAMDRDQMLFVCTQKDFYVEEPEDKDLYEIGTVVEEEIKTKNFKKVMDNLRTLKESLDGILDRPKEER